MTDDQPSSIDKQVNIKQAPSLSDWKALSPWSILSFVFGSLKDILSNGYALIPIFYAGWSNDVSIFWVIDGLIVLLILLTSFAFIQWRKFRYRISTEQLDVKRGLFFTKKDEIPLNRIQNIRFEQPFYFKPLKLAVLVIETAGSSKDEAKLTALDAQHAQILKQHLLQLNPLSQTAAEDNQARIIEPTSTDQPIIKRSLRDLILFGFYQNNFIWFAIIAGPVAGQIEWDKIAQSPFMQTLIEWANQATHNDFMLQLIMVIGLFILGYMLFSVISILASVLKYHPYSLDKHQQTLQRSGGVIAHQQDALAIKRIQIIHFQQPLLARFVNRWTLFLKQVKGNEVEERTKQHMLIPSVKTAEIESIFSQLPSLSPSVVTLPTEYNGINIAWLYKRIWLPFIPFSILLGLFLTLNIDVKLVEIALIAGISVSVLLYIRYKRWGYVLEEDAVWQHSGLLGRDWKRIPFEKIQHMKITQTAGQKTQQLAYLELGLASGTIILPYIPIKVANTLVARSLNTISAQYKQWI